MAGCSKGKDGAGMEKKETTTAEVPEPGMAVGRPLSPKELTAKADRALNEFQTAFAEDPKSPETWKIFARRCRLLDQAGHAGTRGCFLRLVEETAEVALSDKNAFEAYLYLTIDALDRRNSTEAGLYFAKLAPLYKRLQVAEAFDPAMQSYFQYIRGGVLDLQENPEAALEAMTEALEIAEKNVDPDGPEIQRILEKTVRIARLGGKHQIGLKAAERLEKLSERLYGKIHPAVAVAKIMKINILLDMKDNLTAAAEWKYVDDIFGHLAPKDIPPDIDRMYVEAGIRMDIAGPDRPNIKPPASPNPAPAPTP